MRRYEGACGRGRRIPITMIADDVEPVIGLRHEILRVQESPRFVLDKGLKAKPGKLSPVQPLCRVAARWCSRRLECYGFGMHHPWFCFNRRIDSRFHVR